MDDRGFDDLVRRLPHATGTRRGALLGVLAALAGGVGVVEGRKSCATGLTRCKVGKKKRCIDLATDSAHCGACGTACAAGETCTGGVCTGSCIPNCNGNQCGDDGCGGSCGQCGGTQRCRDGRCREPEDECFLSNQPCSGEGTCCNQQQACQLACSESPTCCGLTGARCQDDCDCCGAFSFCSKGGTCATEIPG